MLSAPDASACSAFRLSSADKVYVGKSYDWFFFHGHGYLYTNSRGVSRSALMLGNSVNPAKWISKYGSVTFTQFGRGFPIGGMNENGLVVEMLQLEQAEYNEGEIEKPFVNEAQWTQFQLDNFGTVAEVVANVNSIRVVKGYTGIHYFVTDASGQSAVVEYVNGKAHVYSGEQLPVPALTNDTYPTSLNFLRNLNPVQSWISPLARLSEYRFKNLADYIIAQQKSVPTLKDMWDGLARVQLNGFVYDALFEPSQWNIVYDLKERTIYFRTREARVRKSLQLSQIDFSSSAGEKMLNMNIEKGGNVGGRLVPYSPQLNSNLINQNSWLIERFKLDRAIEHADGER
jgi:choloylglycine hydrolase